MLWFRIERILGAVIVTIISTLVVLAQELETLPERESCTFDSDCEEGFHCLTLTATRGSVCILSCTSDSDCRPGTYCLNGRIGRGECTADCANHTECIFGSFCRTNGQCDNCSKCSEDTGNGSSSSITGTCPAKCNCASHTDCPDESFCTELNECRACDECKHLDTLNSFDQGPCPDTCLCTSSSECEAGDFCADFTKVAGGFVCDDCGTLCTGNRVLSNETCSDVCPYFYRCESHNDCAENAEDEWCNYGHQCNVCSKECTLQDYSADLRMQYEAYLSNPLSNAILFDRPASTSMNFSCPEACCHLGGPTEEEIASFPGERMAFGHCEGEEGIQYEAYYIIGRKDSTISAERLAEEGAPCDVQRYEFTTGFPKIVTIVDCTAVWAGVNNACDERKATLGILVGTVGEDNMQYVDETVMPYTKETRGKDTICPEELTSFIVWAAVILVVLIGLVFFWCVYVDKVKPCWSHRCGKGGVGVEEEEEDKDKAEEEEEEEEEEKDVPASSPLVDSKKSSSTK